MQCQGYRGYISTHMQERSVPQSVQQVVIREYCRKNGLNFLLSATEYCDGFIMLESLVSDYADGIVAYSIWQLPADRDLRHHLYCCYYDEKPLHFAAENMTLITEQDFDRLEDIFLLKGIIDGNK